jgi:hypothetical protein
MSELDRTPTPWKWHPPSKDQAHTGAVYSEVRTGHAYAVAMMPRYQTDEKWKADAEFIIKSVNNHDALIHALQACCRIIKQPDHSPESKIIYDLAMSILENVNVS